MTTLYEVSRQQEQQDEQRPYDHYTDGALAALKARGCKRRVKRSNIALDRLSVVTWRDGKVAYDTEP